MDRYPLDRVPYWPPPPVVKNMNPRTRLEKEDMQSLFYSARQDPYNVKRYDEWYNYIVEMRWRCFKTLSDSPQLKDAVSKDQELVVFNQIRFDEQQLKLNVPNMVQRIVILFYAAPAIYPCPNRGKHIPPWQDILELSWRIDEGESFKDWNHPLNKLDRENTQKRYKVFEQTLDRRDYWQKVQHGQFVHPRKRHPWHC